MQTHAHNPIFQDDVKAREWLESQFWPEGPVCPHCDMLNTATKVHGKTGRPGLYMCNACRSQFTVTVGTLMERSKIPLHKWLYATYLLTSAKDGVSTHRLHDMLDVSLKSTWFMMHRIRGALAEGGSPFAQRDHQDNSIRLRHTAGGRRRKRVSHELAVPPRSRIN